MPHRYSAAPADDRTAIVGVFPRLMLTEAIDAFFRRRHELFVHLENLSPFRDDGHKRRGRLKYSSRNSVSVGEPEGNRSVLKL